MWSCYACITYVCTREREGGVTYVQAILLKAKWMTFRGICELKRDFGEGRANSLRSAFNLHRAYNVR